MKRYILRLVFLAMLLFSAQVIVGQGTPPPPPPGHGQDNDQPAPLGSGFGILAVLGIAFGAKKIYDARKELRK